MYHTKYDVCKIFFLYNFIFYHIILIKYKSRDSDG